MEAEHREVEVGEVRLHVVVQGEGPPVVLLHGFPEFWYAWRDQMQALADAGFRAIAPDMRGYNLSDKPSGVASYRDDRVVADIRGLVHALGYTQVHLIGHDWGGMIAWTFASMYPELVDHLVIMNAGHPKLLSRELRRVEQLKKSWYVFFFQLPGLPELYVRRRSFLEGWLTDWATNPSAFSRSDIDEYHQAIRRPGAARAMINYYRAAFRFGSRASRVPCKTLVIWGDQDKALGQGLLDGLDRYVPDVRIVHLPESSHWVMADEPEAVTRHLLDFFPAPAEGSRAVDATGGS